MFSRQFRDTLARIFNRPAALGDRKTDQQVHDLLRRISNSSPGVNEDRRNPSIAGLADNGLMLTQDEMYTISPPIFALGLLIIRRYRDHLR
jgi:hypothetical protein